MLKLLSGGRWSASGSDTDFNPRFRNQHLCSNCSMFTKFVCTTDIRPIHHTYTTQSGRTIVIIVFRRDRTHPDRMVVDQPHKSMRESLWGIMTCNGTVMRMRCLHCTDLNIETIGRIWIWKFIYWSSEWPLWCNTILMTFLSFLFSLQEIVPESESIVQWQTVWKRRLYSYRCERGCVGSRFEENVNRRGESNY